MKVLYPLVQDQGASRSRVGAQRAGASPAWLDNGQVVRKEMKYATTNATIEYAAINTRRDRVHDRPGRSGGVFGLSRPADASSHREAPFIGGDPEADATDVYAFRSPDKPNTVTLIANYVPLEVAAAGPNFYKFGEDVLYEINVDNDGDAKDDISFQLNFRNRINNGDTFLYNTGPITSLNDSDLNQEQFYSLSVLKGRRSVPEGEGHRQQPAGRTGQRGAQVLSPGLQQGGEPGHLYAR